MNRDPVDSVRVGRKPAEAGQEKVEARPMRKPARSVDLSASGAAPFVFTPVKTVQPSPPVPTGIARPRPGVTTTWFVLGQAVIDFSEAAVTPAALREFRGATLASKGLDTGTFLLQEPEVVQDPEIRKCECIIQGIKANRPKGTWKGDKTLGPSYAKWHRVSEIDLTLSASLAYLAEGEKGKMEIGWRILGVASFTRIAFNGVVTFWGPENATVKVKIEDAVGPFAPGGKPVLTGAQYLGFMDGGTIELECPSHGVKQIEMRIDSVETLRYRAAAYVQRLFQRNAHLYPEGTNSQEWMPSASVDEVWFSDPGVGLDWAMRWPVLDVTYDAFCFDGVEGKDSAVDNQTVLLDPGEAIVFL